MLCLLDITLSMNLKAITINQFKYSLIAMVILLLWFSPLSAKPLIGDMSEYQVDISSTFTGKNIILFGAQNDPGDVVIVARGPKQNAVVRKKKEIFGGMWINDTSVTFLDIPRYYSINGSNSTILNSPAMLYDALEIGQNQLEFNSAEHISSEQHAEFKAAYIEYQQEKGLFRHFTEPLKFMDDTLFKTLIAFPDTLPRGDYAVDMYLIEDGALRTLQTLPISVNKVGFDAFIYDLAHQHSVLYALMAIAIALSVGWSISQLFSRII